MSKKRMMMKRLGYGAVYAVALATLPQSATAVGGQLGLEFAIDVPWRIEPTLLADGQYSYGPIPVYVTFQDAIFEMNRGWLEEKLMSPLVVGRLKEIRVAEVAADGRRTVTVVKPQDLIELERKTQISTKTNEPQHEFCRPAPGQDCSNLWDISNTHDWHASFWFTPKRAMQPGLRLPLEITVVTTLERVGVPPSTSSSRSERHWTNRFVVNAGHAPLPRFGDAWLYGDLHYHSQMTDNEGETGYSYRSVVRAMGAMGLDFAFATDHASNGVQVDGGMSSKACPPSQTSRFVGCQEARDLNPTRFAAAKSILYGPDGANEAIGRDAQKIARVRSADVLPQLYMGEELDAIPEMSALERNDGAIRYGDGLRYLFADPNGCAQKAKTQQATARCIDTFSKQNIDGDRVSYFVLDRQGVPVEDVAGDVTGIGPVDDIIAWGAGQAVPDDMHVMPRFSRQHLVYFPDSGGPNGAGWIGSDTNLFGGGTRTLRDVTSQIERLGVAFLAHPLESAHPGNSTPSDVDPAQTPYSEIALSRAWRSQGILGLEFWNENSIYTTEGSYGPPIRHESDASMAQPIAQQRYIYLYPWLTDNPPWLWKTEKERSVGEFDRLSERGKLLYHGAFTWDRWLRRGLDSAQTVDISWLARGEPRKWFMSAGSDGHGDFNYRRHGRPYCDILERWCDKPASDTAIGNPRNLVDLTPTETGRPVIAQPRVDHTPSGPKRYANTQVLDALKAGRFSVTDGPALRIAIDRNRNNLIDPRDFQMGSTMDYFPGEHIPVLVEWISTPEFGPIKQIDLYVGNKGTTYAPQDTFNYGGPGTDPTDRYAPDPSSALRINVTTVEGGYKGLARVYIGPAQFGLVPNDQALSYIRAVAKTMTAPEAYARVELSDSGSERHLCPAPRTAGSKCGDRLAYSNPVWARYRMNCPAAPAQGAAVTPAGRNNIFLDSDANGVPDTCERNVPDPCAPRSDTRAGRAAALTPYSGGRGNDLPRAAGPEMVSSGPVAAKPVPLQSCKVFN